MTADVTRLGLDGPEKNCNGLTCCTEAAAAAEQQQQEEEEEEEEEGGREESRKPGGREEDQHNGNTELRAARDGGKRQRPACNGAEVDERGDKAAGDTQSGKGARRATPSGGLEEGDLGQSRTLEEEGEEEEEQREEEEEEVEADERAGCRYGGQESQRNGQCSFSGLFVVQKLEGHRCLLFQAR